MRTCFALALCAALAASRGAAADADLIIIDGPPSSGFGSAIELLPGGRFAVSAPWALGNRGAVYLYDANGILIDQITGNAQGDSIGGSIVAVGDGNLVVCSPAWNGQRGAVTWLPGTGGWPDVVSAANSLVGSTPMDAVCLRGVVRLANGNFVVRSPAWQSAPELNVGAVTWGDGNNALVGVVSPANSLVGSHDGDADDQGMETFLALANGNYVVAWAFWANGAAAFAGAVTFANGATGTSGVVSATNSVVGTQSGDGVGTRLVALANGNAAIVSPNWDRGGIFNAGAVTWMSGTVGLTGAVGIANSLVGVSENDFVGDVVTPLSNGNFVVGSPRWSRTGPGSDHGAATWVNGSGPVSGQVGEANSLVGANDIARVGSSVSALSNGNYVVVAPNGTATGGTVTWADGTQATTGVATSANSLVGNGAVGGGGVFALRNGNYVVVTSQWLSSSGETGAITWGNGLGGTVGPLSSANSVVTSQVNEFVGAIVVPLANGNYVLSVPSWNAPGAYAAGAAMLVSGVAATTGTISAATALVGSVENDFVGGPIGFPLATPSIAEVDGGDYFVRSSYWDLPGGTADAGAITRRSGGSFVGNAVSVSNSVVGGYAGEQLGSRSLTALPDGSVMALTAPTAQQPGSAVWLPPARTVTGEPQDEIRVNGPWSLLRFDAPRARALLGAPDASRVVLWTAPHDTLFRDGYE